MFFKSLAAIAVLAVSLALDASAQAIITPALGVTGSAAQTDVQQPSTSSPCGSIDISSALGSSTAVAANGNTFDVTITNFADGSQGSRQVTAKVDPTCTGDSFVDTTITQNGDQVRL